MNALTVSCEKPLMRGNSINKLVFPNVLLNWPLFSIDQKKFEAKSIVIPDIKKIDKKSGL